MNASNDIVHVKFDNGDYYEGRMTNGKMDGGKYIIYLPTGPFFKEISIYRRIIHLVFLIIGEKLHGPMEVPMKDNLLMAE